MNALALVCNLYADGPRSLSKLRAAGRVELEDVLGLSADELVQLLGMSASAAERFLREAETLGRRVDSEFLDAEGEAAFEQDALLPRGSRSSPSSESLSPPPPHAAARPAAGPLDALIPQAVDGLDANTCARLEAAGVRSLAQLAARGADDLARVTGLTFSGVRRLQFLAGRQVTADSAARGEVIPAPRAPLPTAAPGGATPETAAAKVSLAEGPRPRTVAAFEEELSERAGDEAAGPFA